MGPDCVPVKKRVVDSVGFVRLPVPTGNPLSIPAFPRSALWPPRRVCPWAPATRPGSATRLRVTEIRLTRCTLCHRSRVVLTGRHHPALLVDGPVTDVPIAGHSIAGRRGGVNGPKDHLDDRDTSAYPPSSGEGRATAGPFVPTV